MKRSALTSARQQAAHTNHRSRARTNAAKHTRFVLIAAMVTLHASAALADVYVFQDSGPQGGKITLSGPNGTADAEVPRNVSAEECAKAAERAARRAGLDVHRNGSSVSFDTRMTAFFSEGGCRPIRERRENREASVDKSAIEFLVGALASDSPKIRAQAMAGLAEIDRELVPMLDQLVPHVENADPRVVDFTNERFESLGVLSITPLTSALRATSWQIRNSAYDRLRSIRLQRDTPSTNRTEISAALREDLRTSRPRPASSGEAWSAASRQVLARLQADARGGSREGAASKPPSALDGNPEEVLAGLSDCLEHQDEQVRWRAARYLALIGERAAPALERLVALLGDQYGDLARASENAILAIDPSGSRVIPLLCQATESPSSDQRSSAARVLRMYAERPLARTCLLERLESPDPEVAWVAANALESQYAQVRPELLTVAKTGSLQARQLAVQLAGAVEDDQSSAIAATIRNLASDSQSPLRFSARRALSDIEHRKTGRTDASRSKPSYFVTKVQLLEKALTAPAGGKARARPGLEAIVKDVVATMLASSRESEAFMVFAWMSQNLSTFKPEISARLSDAFSGSLVYVARNQREPERSRTLAIQLLADRRTEVALPTLLWALGDAKVSGAAAEALLPFGCQLIWRLLSEIPGTRSPLAREQMQRLVSKLGGNSLMQFLRDGIEKADSAEERTTKALILGKFVRADRFGFVSGSDVVRVLLDLVEGFHPEARNAAVMGLIASGEPAVEPVLSKLGTSNEKELLLTILHKLPVPSRGGYSSVHFREVYNIFQNGNDQARAMAAALLGGFGQEGAEELARVLDQSYLSGSELASATSALVVIGKPAVSVMVDRFKAYSISDDDKYKRYATVLLNIGAPAIGPLIDTLSGRDDNQRYWAIQILFQLKAHDAVEPLEALAQKQYDNDRIQRMAAGAAHELSKERY